jgi:hypothetical protein
MTNTPEVAAAPGVSLGASAIAQWTDHRSCELLLRLSAVPRRVAALRHPGGADAAAAGAEGSEAAWV